MAIDRFDVEKAAKKASEDNQRMIQQLNREIEYFIIISLLSGKSKEWIEEELNNNYYEPMEKPSYSKGMNRINECYENEDMPRGGYLDGADAFS